MTFLTCSFCGYIYPKSDKTECPYCGMKHTEQQAKHVKEEGRKEDRSSARRCA